MAESDKARQAILDAIEAMAPKATRPSGVLALAEALAWTRDPGQGHGSTTTVSK